MSVRRTVHLVKPEVTPRVGFLGHLLDPIDRLSETIYSVLIALIFTLAYRILMLNNDFSFSSGYGFNVSFAILGAALAWGIIDGIMYALISVFQRRERHRLLQQIKTAKTMETAVTIIADELDFILEPITSSEQRDALYVDILDHLREGKSQKVGLQREDVVGALGSVLVAFLAVLPSLVPLMLLPQNTALAIRISNFVSFIVLFSAGYGWGKHTHTNPWQTGLLLAGVGLIMVLIAIPLGG